MVEKQAVKNAQLEDMVEKQAAKNAQLEDMVEKVMELVYSLQSTVQAQQVPYENVEDDNGED
jgi:hypothetical protein